MKKKAWFAGMMAAVLAAALIPLPSIRVDAYPYVQAGLDSDPYVYAYGVYDLVVFVKNADEPTYQWFVGIGRNVPIEDLIRLDDNDSYSGTKTNHLRLITHEGDTYKGDGEGWEALYFTCMVKDANGDVAWGPDMNMIVYSHEALMNRLEKEGVGFTSVSVNAPNATVSFDGEEDGVRHYSVYGKFSTTGLRLSHVYTPVPPEVRRYSEVETRVEKFVTYDGKTVPFDASNGEFMPKKYGRNAVSFRSDLVLYVNDKRMETLDSVTTAVDVWPSEGISVALTKGETAVMEERYMQSRVVTRLEKNERVRILEESGGFYRVAVNGYFGFVDRLALNVVPEVTSVELTTQEPCAGSFITGDVTLSDPDLYQVESRFNEEMWYDKTAGKFLKKGDAFKAGHSYRLTVWVTVKDGKRFAQNDYLPSVVGRINGLKTMAVKAYEQDPEEVIELSVDYDHVHSLTKVNRVYPTCTTPGKEYYYTCSCGWGFEDNNAASRITDGNWGVIPARGHWASEWKSNGTSHYRVCQRRDCGATIEGTLGAHAGGQATCQNGAFCTVCQLEYGAKGSHVWSTNWDYKDAAGHAHACTALCGTHGAVQAHRPGKEATETEPQVCLDCGYVIKAAGNAPETTEATRPGITEEETESSSAESGTEETAEAESGTEETAEAESGTETEASAAEGTEIASEAESTDPGETAETVPASGTETAPSEDEGSASPAFPWWILVVIIAAFAVLGAGAIVAAALISRKKKE